MFKERKTNNRKLLQKFTLLILLTSILLTLTSCGLFKKESQEETDVDISSLSEEELAELEESLGLSIDKIENKEETAGVEVYFQDKYGHIVPQTVNIPAEEGIAKLTLQALIKNGPLTDLIPNGFQAVLPPDTEVLGINLVDDLATVDLSTAFLDYDAASEDKILQAITWTLTQFDSINKVKLQVNGHDLDEMPVQGTAIGDGLTRSIGINNDTMDVVDITNTEALTVYYLGHNNDNYYYVPVTKRVKSDIGVTVESTIEQLVSGPGYSSNLITDFLPTVALLDRPTVNDGKVVLNFNDAITSSVENEAVISDHMLMSLVLSLTEHDDIESVAVLVNGNEQIVNDKGESLSAPVFRPTKINAEEL